MLGRFVVFTAVLHDINQLSESLQRHRCCCDFVKYSNTMYVDYDISITVIE